MEIQKKKRTTKQKKLVYDVLASTKSHPTAEWIYEEASKVIPDISLGTVYRNLNVLLNEGRIQELNYTNSQSRYDANPQLHYHFVCKNCNSVIDCEMPVLELPEDFYKAIPGHCESYRMEFKGSCYKCLKQG